MTIAQAGDTVLLVGRDMKYFMLRLTPGQELHTHRGLFPHDALIGQPLGTEVFSHLGHPFFLLQPSTDDLIREIKRTSQIMYPKDLGFVLLKLAIRPGLTVLEAGTGSGGLTTVLAQAVGPQGRVISYEVREDVQNLAKKNVARLGLAERVTFKLRDIAQGFDETGVQALFLDVPNPWDYAEQAYRALESGGFFGSLLPTTNQVSQLLIALRRSGFEFLEVCEILLRYYKPVPERLRPADRMVAHTGFLIFGRPVVRATPPEPEIAAATPDEVNDREPEADEAP
jgi:tRNA (adenine57-N1/adenine58-N1)-methyltransferase